MGWVGLGGGEVRPDPHGHAELDDLRHGGVRDMHPGHLPGREPAYPLLTEMSLYPLSERCRHGRLTVGVSRRHRAFSPESGRRYC